MNRIAEGTRAFASVAYFFIPGLLSRGVTEQARLREGLAHAIAAGWGLLDDEERIALDAADGAALVALNHPPRALAAALAVRDAAARARVPLVTSLHLGAIHETPGARNESMIGGEALETATAIALQCRDEAGAMVLSAPFRAALDDRAPELADGCVAAGRLEDPRRTAHALFRYDPAVQRARGQRLVFLGAAAALAVLAVGLAANLALEGWRVAREPALLRFEVRPAADITIDGVAAGRTTDPTPRKVRPGAHVVELKSGRLPPQVLDIEVAAGEERVIRHSFAQPVPRKKPLIERLKFWKS